MRTMLTALCALAGMATAANAQMVRPTIAPIRNPPLREIPAGRLVLPPDVLGKPMQVAKPDAIELTYQAFADWTVTPIVSGGLSGQWACTAGPWELSPIPDNTRQTVKCVGTPVDKSVTLQIKAIGTGPKAGQSFFVRSYAWSGGDCAQNPTDTCTLVMDKPRKVEATVWDMSKARYHLTVTGDGSVTVDGKTCTSTEGKSTDCYSIVNVDDVKTLTAVPGSGKVLGAWKKIAACDEPGPALTCSSIVKGAYGATEPTAEFIARPGPVRIDIDIPDRAGRIDVKGPDAATSIACVNDTVAGKAFGQYCSLVVPWGTPLTWTATPDQYSIFLGYMLSKPVEKQLGKAKCPIGMPCTMRAATDITAIAQMKSGRGYRQLLVEWNNEADIDHEIAVSPASQKWCKDSNCQWLLPDNTLATITYHKRRKSTGEIVKFYGTGFNAGQCTKGLDEAASTCTVLLDDHRSVYLQN